MKLTLVDQASSAHAALSPLRLRILGELEGPASATELAGRLELSRQKVNYHLGVLEAHGLIELVEERQRRGFLERRFQRRGNLVLAPDLVEPDLSTRDARSAQALVAAASDAIRAVSTLSEDAAAGQRLATATMAAEVTFGSPADLRAFLEGVAQLAARFDRGTDGHRMRITLLSHSIQHQPSGGATRD